MRQKKTDEKAPKPPNKPKPSPPPPNNDWQRIGPDWDYWWDR